MLCIECGSPVTSLYTAYSSNNIRLTACPNCGKFADKYIEHDSVLIFIDLVLIKPQVYRHLAFNRLAISPHLHTSMRKIFVLITLFDVYLTWARVEKEGGVDGGPQSMAAMQQEILRSSVITQYLFFVMYCLTETIATHLVIRYLARAVVHQNKTKDDTSSSSAAPYDPNIVTIALLISSATKMFPMLMVIWSYDIPAAAKAVGWAVNVSTVEALNIVLMCGHVNAIGLMGIAVLVRRAVMRLLVWLWVGRSGLGVGIYDELSAVGEFFSVLARR
ncbi:Arv1-like family-domain-containing protein [Limtongia smithiae]|uniref:Arv1-like family-domain-containing protein n=1 Tax=Limtongia smithiae TaxID=1125753 RepID=UPI0034CEF264